MHRILERQIKHASENAPQEELSPHCKALLEVVSETYAHFDEEHTLLMRSLELSSKEFVDLNKKLQSENEVIEQKVKERTLELEYEKTKLNEILEHMRTGALLVRKDWSVAFANVSAKKMLAVTGDKESLDALVKRFSSVHIKERIIAALEGSTSVSDAEETEIEGSFFSVSFVPMKRSTGVTEALVWIDDVTEQKQLERAKNEFLQIAAHEMRTPLAVIRGNAELIASESETVKNAEIKSDAETILKNAIQLLGIVNNFLDIQNIEVGKISLKLEPVDISKVLVETVSDLSKLATEKNISLSYVPPNFEVPMLTLDLYRLQQIFVNLISNAIHYTKYGGVTVSIEKRENVIAILFKDTGIGIDKKDQEHLFHRFETGKSFIRSREYGSGLGLYIAHLLANALGGVLALEKSELNVGSVFCLAFPIK